MQTSRSLEFDFVVIGSGFGGAVAALRLSEKGYRVAVLEQGRRFAPADFARTSWDLRRYLWLPGLGLHGIQAVSMLRHVVVLHGVGVGGGSLVYANQLLTPPPEVFARDEWRGADWSATLSPHFAEARRMLGATRCPDVGRTDEILREVGVELRGADTFTVNDVGVFFGTPGVVAPDPYFGGAGPPRRGCTRCGACMVGCRVGAKNTLDRNYLYLAERLGATILDQREVVAFRPAGRGYELFARSTAPRTDLLRVRAGGVVVAAGVLGTVKLLLHSRARGWLPRLSPMVGQLVRTNAESLLTVESPNEGENWSDHVAITSGIQADDDTRVQMVRYNTGSDLLLMLTTLLTDGGGRIPRALRLAGNVARHPLAFAAGFRPHGRAARTAVVLAMQPTDNHLSLELRPRWWRLGASTLASSVPEGSARAPSYLPVANEVARRFARRVDGVARNAISDVVFGAPTTAHILGGCVMGETPESGVVDLHGALHGYPNVYVTDGSIVPGNLGVNPSLTITALAEHVMTGVQPPHWSPQRSTPAAAQTATLDATRESRREAPGAASVAGGSTGRVGTRTG